MASQTLTPWSLSIKTVGGQDTEGKAENNFSVSVSPDDDLSKLYNEIEHVTGVKASHQRLIYRGRIINHHQEKEKAPPVDANQEDERQREDESGPEKKIRDVVGLSDGHTIHLVPKPSTPGSNSSSATNSRSDSNSSSEDSEGDVQSGSGTASLLAALLGISTDDDDDNDNATSSASARSPQLRTPSSLTRSARRIRRPQNYRLTVDDPVHPEPGSMEPVRQSLMTLFTMLGSTTNTQPNTQTGEGAENQIYDQPHASRKWYRGQWVDCLDTVNQWLEATVVDIVCPEDVLPPRMGNRRQNNNRPARRGPESTDPAVTANDFEGRRRLLLEPCGEGDSDDEEGELAGFRERDNNESVQLLLIHYNGWPHRWDEWIRSDSERIRPFRTRTRHPASAPFMSPSPQSTFHAAPSTHIRDDDDDEADRSALLPELSRAISAVNNLLLQALPTNVGNNVHSLPPISASTSNNMPWLEHCDGGDNENRDETPLLEENDVMQKEEGENEISNRQLTRTQLEALAPLIDRLGRTLTDAAPHVAALAASLPHVEQPTENITNSREPSTSDETSEEIRDDTLGTSSGSGLFSLLSRESRRRSRTNDDDSSLRESPYDERTHPDHVDFVNGMVNTYRGEDRTNRRERSEDGTSLLGAYLAAASFSNLASNGTSDNNENGGGSGPRVRQGAGGGVGSNGGGAGGIDIHIHAIVTGPGVGPGGMELAILGGGGGGGTTPTPMRSLGVSRQPRALPSALIPIPPTTDIDDMGLFSELYSENPQPLDPYGATGNQTESNESDTNVARTDAEGDSDGYPHHSSPFPGGTLPDRRVRPSSSSLNELGSRPRRGGSVRRLFRRFRRSPSRSSNFSSPNSSHH